MTMKINFKQPKYMLPAILYPLLLIAGWFVIDMFQTEVAETNDSGLQSMESLNSNLPEAHLKEDIGSKRQNMQNSFGNISDLSAIDGIENDADSLKKTEDYESRYSDQEAAALEEQDALKRLREMQARLQSSSQGMDFGDDDFMLSDEDRQSLEIMRRRRMMSQFQEDLAQTDQDELMDIDSTNNVISMDSESSRKAVSALDEDAENLVVVKKVNENSDYFNTWSETAIESRLIKAIIDEEIKAKDGSRVRLRLLDAIDIDGVVLDKGNYLYATLSGFGSQRVQGKIESVLAEDELYKISLSIYDLDGMEGLYVPSSSFRETAKDIASSATQGDMMTNTDIRNSLTQWAGQALQNAYQQTSNAISKAIKKNRVRLKYGTQVYLVNSNKTSRNNR